MMKLRAATLRLAAEQDQSLTACRPTRFTSTHDRIPGHSMSLEYHLLPWP